MMKIFNLLLVVLLFGAPTIAQEKGGVSWHNPEESEIAVVAGQAWASEVVSFYDRLPARAKESVRKPVWGLSKNSAGLSIRFWSNSESISVKYRVRGSTAMKHMPSTGVSGVDLYAKSYHGEWLRCWGSYSIGAESSYKFKITDRDKKYGYEYQLFLPLYNSVDSLVIGVDEDATFNYLPIRGEKPVVAYGTSICQGACATRPGMAWTNILERRLERPVINLGFSGNGKLEPALIDLMAEIDAKVYIIDCLPNLKPEHDDTYQLALDGVKRLKAKRPDVPIILTEHIGYADEFTNRESREKYTALNIELKRAFDRLILDGVSGLYLLTREEMGLDFDSYVDIIHPNDIGMVKYADSYERLIRRVLREEGGVTSTTEPVTQSRDIATYQWEERHQQILSLNRAEAPKVCLFGNSIVNFWGGDPYCKDSGLKSWQEVLEPKGVRNFGFGWDRVENVLWRVYHDELDGFSAEKVVLMIGTNNIGIDSDRDIVAGIEKVVKAVRVRQPEAIVTVVGILPRRGGKKRVEALNRALVQMASLNGVGYLEIGEGLKLESGEINEELFSDGLHPNEEGYGIMAEGLKKIL